MLRIVGLTPLLVLSVWLMAGTPVDWQMYLVYAAVWAWVCELIAVGLSRYENYRAWCIDRVKDPAFWCGLAFLAYLGLQSWNSGRIRAFDPDSRSYRYSSPPIPFLPGSFVGAEAMEMIRWFFPALTVYFLTRALPSRATLRTLVKIAVWNALAAGVLGLVHLALGWTTYLNTGRVFGKQLFGTFAYRNHAAGFFVLMFSLALGMLLRLSMKPEKASRRGVPRWISGVIAVAGVLIPGVAANAVASRFAIVGTGIALCFAVFWRTRITKTERIPGWWTLLAAGMLVTVLWIMWSFPVFAPFRDEVGQLAPGGSVGTWSQRLFPFQLEAAWRIWKDAPWFGVGGWGVKYLLGMYLAPSLWRDLPYAYANLHHDPLQFLVEFGLVGVGLLLGAVGGAFIRIAQDLLRPRRPKDQLWLDPLRLFAAFGVLLILAQSLVDLPLRCPAILIHVCFCLAVAARPGAGGSSSIRGFAPVVPSPRSTAAHAAKRTSTAP